MEYKEIFGEDFYLELMRHGIGDQHRIDEQIIRLSKETGIKIIATNDTHYTMQDDADAHEAFMCIAMNKLYDDPNRLRHSVHEFYVKSPQQMAELFADIPEAYSNTQEIVDKCNLEIKLGDPTPPNFKFARARAEAFGITMPEPDKEYSLENDKVLFIEASQKGLENRLKIVPAEKHQEYRERLAGRDRYHQRNEIPRVYAYRLGFCRCSEANGHTCGTWTRVCSGFACRVFASVLPILTLYRMACFLSVF